MIRLVPSAKHVETLTYGIAKVHIACSYVSLEGANPSSPSNLANEFNRLEEYYERY